jgi:hypothetical protein
VSQPDNLSSVPDEDPKSMGPSARRLNGLSVIICPERQRLHGCLSFKTEMAGFFLIWPQMVSLKAPPCQIICLNRCNGISNDKATLFLPPNQGAGTLFTRLGDADCHGRPAQNQTRLTSATPARPSGPFTSVGSSAVLPRINRSGQMT